MSDDWISRSKVVNMPVPPEAAPEAPEWIARSRLVTTPAPEEPQGDAWPNLEASGKTGAALRGFAHNVSLGAVDELSGLVRGGTAGISRLVADATKTGPGRALVRQLVPSAKALHDPQLQQLLELAMQETSGLMGLSSLPEGLGDAARSGYVAGRNDLRGDNERAKQVRFSGPDGSETSWYEPTPFGLGGVAGSLALPVGAAGAGTKGLKLLGGAAYLAPRAAQMAKTGAAMGAGYGAGASEADLVDDARAQSAGGAGRLALDTAVGGALGAGVSVGAGKLLDAGARKLAQWSSENAARAAGLVPGISDKAAKAGLHSAEEVRQFGRKLLDMGLIRFGSTPESVGKAGMEAKLGYGAMIDDALAQGTAAGGKPNLPAIAKLMRDDLQRGATSAVLDKAGPAMHLADLVEEQAGINSSFEAANALKSDLYKHIPGAYGNPAPPIEAELQKNVLSTLRKGMETELRRVAGPEAAEQLATANNRYGTLLKLGQLSGNQERRDIAKNKLGSLISAVIGAGGGWLIGGGTGAAAGASGFGLGHVLGQIVAPRVPAAAAVTQRALAPLLPVAALPVARSVPPALVDWIEREPTEDEQTKARAAALRKR